MIGDPFGPLPAGGAVPFFSYKTLPVLQKNETSSHNFQIGN